MCLGETELGDVGYVPDPGVGFREFAAEGLEGVFGVFSASGGVGFLEAWC
jgi:hypothetical protein